MRHDRSERAEAPDELRAHPMTALIAVMLAGGVGVALRYLLHTVITTRTGDGFPWSTLLINISGAFALGLLLGLLADQSTGMLMRTAVGIGLIGGFTTFSTFALETVALAEGGRLVRAATYVTATNVLGLGAMVAGLAIGRSGG